MSVASTPGPRPELLAPAGDWDAMRAAVANGADAVYFGLDQFNARHRATNFTLAELPEVMGMSDRIVVMRAGRMVEVLDNENLTADQVVRLAIGVEGAAA